MKFKIAICVFCVISAYGNYRLNERVKVLERKATETVEIVVERAYDVDMRAYGYKLLGEKGYLDKTSLKAMTIGR